MILSDIHITEFQKLYKQEHDIDLTFEQATERAYQVMHLYLCLRNRLWEKTLLDNPNPNGK